MAAWNRSVWSIVAVLLEDPTDAFDTWQDREYHHMAVVVLLHLPWQSAIVQSTDVEFNLMQKLPLSISVCQHGPGGLLMLV